MSGDKIGYYKTSYRKGLCFVFSTYWIILVIWQNISGASLRGVADTILKLVLLAFLTFKFLSRKRYVVTNDFILAFLFTSTQLITFFLNDSGSFNLGIAVYYIFPILFVWLTYGVGNRFCVKEDELEIMGKIVMAVCVYAILYTLIVEPEQFIVAFSSKTGYGGELHSFFISMNEFAMYLFYGIVSCVMKIEKLKHHSLFKRVIYYLLFLVLFGVQILTFSRTAILGTLAFLIIYSILFFNSRQSKIMLGFLLIAIVVIFNYEPVRIYFYETVFKSGRSDSRQDLYHLAISYFQRGTLVQKIFGHGISNTRAYFSAELTYGSVHNGYLQVLVYYGVVGLAFLIIFLLSQCIAAIRMFRVDKYIGVLSLAMLSFAGITMMSSTQIIFHSSIDCFFLTSMLIVIPKYMRNAVCKKCFYRET